MRVCQQSGCPTFGVWSNQASRSAPQQVETRQNVKVAVGSRTSSPFQRCPAQKRSPLREREVTKLPCLQGQRRCNLHGPSGREPPLRKAAKLPVASERSRRGFQRGIHVDARLCACWFVARAPLLRAPRPLNPLNPDNVRTNSLFQNPRTLLRAWY